MATVASLAPTLLRCATRVPPISSAARRSNDSAFPSPTTTMRLAGRLAGPTTGTISLRLPRKRGEAASARAIAPPLASSSWRAEGVNFPSSQTPTATAPECDGTLNSAKLIFIVLARQWFDGARQFGCQEIRLCRRDRGYQTECQCRKYAREVISELFSRARNLR